MADRNIRDFLHNSFFFQGIIFDFLSAFIPRAPSLIVQNQSLYKIVNICLLVNK